MKNFVFLLLAMVIICGPSWANTSEDSKINLIIQNESSIQKIEKDRFMLNPERLEFNEGSIFLNTDLYGKISVHDKKF